MMENLRLTQVEVKSSNSIVLEFTHKLSLGATSDNIKIYSTIDSVPDSEVLELKQKDNFIFITCQPLTPFVQYNVTAIKSFNYPFLSINGTAQLQQDTVSNVFKIFGPIEKENLFKSLIKESLKDNVYDLDNQSSVPSIVVNSLSVFLDKALEDIKTVKNENYISFDVIDEIKVRGSGPFDKLNEGSAYEIIRVSPHQSNSNLKSTLQINTSKYKIYSLQEEKISEIVYPDYIDGDSIFNINNFILSLSKINLTKIESIKFTLATSDPIYEYDLNKYGYQIKDNKYDDLSSTLTTLKSNQIKLNDEILNDSLFDLTKIVKVDVVYFYKNVGKIISPNIDVYQVRQSIREVVPPIINSFFLKHSPIVDLDANSIENNGIEFTNLNLKQRNYHPAFSNEIKFRYESLPSIPGQYSIDYSTGKVFVFGEDLTSNGTGATPPLFTYNYKYNFINEIDFVYDDKTYDIAFLPNGGAIDQNINVGFSYEYVFVNGKDFKANLHEESLNERIGNKILALNCVKVANYPITNVYRILNETSGEVYTLNRFTENKVYFKYTTPPNIQKSIEQLSFAQTTEKLNVLSYKTNNSLTLIACFELSKKPIISNNENSIANFMNTSLKFDNSLFVTEKSFIDLVSQSDNLNKLNIGDYCVDYVNSVVYLAISSKKDSYGNATYKFSSLDTNSKHVLFASDCGYYNNSLQQDLKVDSVDDGLINVSNVFNTNNTYQNYLGNIGYFSGSTFIPKVNKQIKSLYGVYEYNDFVNSTNPINFSNYCSFIDQTISYSNYVKQFYCNVEYESGFGYFVRIPKEISYQSTSLTYNFEAKIINGSNVNVIGFTIEDNENLVVLDTTSLDLIELTLTISINNFSNLFIDYSIGDIKSEFTYLADEIIVSYEYGANSLDFRESFSLSEGDQYYVSYRVGALRDALVRNFSSLINIQELSTLDTYFDRERYRDSIYAALSSFIQGPTTAAIINIVKTIAHTTPEIIESIFNTWTLGENLLNPNKITSSPVSLDLLKKGNGVIINNNEFVSIPTFSNISEDEGTLEFWVKPNWNGIDNDSELNFEIFDGGLPINDKKVFIGANEVHPSSNKFSVSKSSIVFGEPNKNKDGIFIYMDKDLNQNYDRWYLYVSDGYVSGYSDGLDIRINGNDFYDFSIVDGYDASTITTTPSFIKIKTKENQFAELYSFVCDYTKYFIDTENDNCKFSIYKDRSGFLSFYLKDFRNKTASVSHDISDWKVGETHHIAASWKINSKARRDELHLFVDGQEVKNISNYTNNVPINNNQKFRNIGKETIISLVDRDILSGKDLELTSGSDIVKSLTNFNSYNIFVGDLIYIDDPMFSGTFQILEINGQELKINTISTISINNIKFTINKTLKDVSGRYYLNTNNYVYSLSTYLDGYDLQTTSGSTLVSSGINFTGLCNPGDLIRIDNINYNIYYTIISVLGNVLELDSEMPASNTNLVFYIYSSEESELISPRNDFPDYTLDKNKITLLNNVKANDLIFISTLGLNHEIAKGKYYVWSDSTESIIKTQLPKPVNLDEVNIYKIILDSTVINQSNSTMLVNYFESTFTCDNPINSQSGRELEVFISGRNIDFNYPLYVEINGNSNYLTITETIEFNNYGNIKSLNKFYEIYSIKVKGNCLNINKDFCSIKVKEYDTIFNPQVSYYSPELKYSYVINSGTNLYKLTDNSVKDDLNIFSNKNVGDYLVISEPIEVAGYYYITAVSQDLKSFEINPLSTAYTLPLSDFTDGYYQILNTKETSSGIQNGFFNFQPIDYPGQPYFLRKGFYEFEYPTYLNMDFKFGKDLFFGCNSNKENQCKSIIGELVIYNVCLTDVRKGESITENNSITKDYNSIKNIKNNKNILFNCNFDEYPFVNSADFYVSKKDKNIIYSNTSVNDNFKSSAYLKNKSIKVYNEGYLDSKNEGTIEFWINPIYDTLNDYAKRFYFDSSSYSVENVISKNKSQVYVSGNPEEIISVKVNGSNLNYFSGGRIEFVKTNSKSITLNSVNKNKITLNEEIGDVLSVNISSDLSKIDFYRNGSFDSFNIYLEKSLPYNTTEVIVSFIPKSTDVVKNKVIILGKELPSNNTKVEVTYIEKGTNGGRISIFKDRDNFINFEISGYGSSNVARAPVGWSSGEWHKIKACYRINSHDDRLSLFIDGYEYNSFTYGESNYYSDSPFNYGSVFVGDGYNVKNTISFKDTLNYFTIGSDFNNANFGNCIIDNLRISNKCLDKSIYKNEYVDITYDVPSVAIPLTYDLYTTYLMDYDLEYEKFNKFAKLINKNNSFEFDVNVFDSFKILEKNPRSKVILEKLIKTLKPASSKVFINYI